MKKTKLIIVEGIPGSGKTTTAIYIKKLLDNANIDNVLFCEGDLNHPADFESVACLTKREYENLAEKFSSYREYLESRVIKKGDNNFFHYRRLKNEEDEKMTQELFNEPANYDICDSLSLERYQELTLERWREFAEQVDKGDKVYILECCFIQNPAVIMMARHFAGKEYIINHVLQIESIIKKLNPRLIYFYQNSVRETIEKVAKTRDKGWLNFVIEYVCNQAYGKRLGLKGFDGVIKFFEDRKEIELEVIEKLCMDKVILDNSEYNWSNRCREIEEFIRKPGEEKMRIERNAKIDVNELNELLGTIGWKVNSIEKLENSLKLSWGWITARDESNKLISFVQVLSDGIKHAYILRLLVHRDYQGQGIGTKIVQNLMDLLKENKLNPVLITKPTEEAFYSKFGFARENGGFISLFKWE